MNFEFSEGLTAKPIEILKLGIGHITSSEVCVGVFFSHKKSTFYVQQHRAIYWGNVSGSIEELDKSGRPKTTFGDFSAIQLGSAKIVGEESADGGHSEFFIYQLQGKSITSDYCRKFFDQESAEDGRERSQGELVHVILADSDFSQVQSVEKSPELKAEYVGPDLQSSLRQHWELANQAFGPDFWLNDPTYSELENQNHSYDHGLLIRDGEKCFWIGKSKKEIYRTQFTELAVYRSLEPRIEVDDETVAESYIHVRGLASTVFSWETEDRKIPLRTLILFEAAPEVVLNQALKDRDCYFRWVDLHHPKPLESSVSYPTWEKMSTDAKDIRNFLQLRLSDLQSQVIFAFTEQQLPALFSGLSTYISSNCFWDDDLLDPCFVLTYEVSEDEFVLDVHLSTLLNLKVDPHREKMMEVLSRLFSFVWPTTWSGEMLLELAINRASWQGQVPRADRSSWKSANETIHSYQDRPEIPYLGQWVMPDRVRVSLSMLDLNAPLEQKANQLQETRTEWLSRQSSDFNFDNYFGTDFLD